ncbi:MAG: hypothetical protein K6G24_10795 [Lachnospiraceae bacterium]|nr:hypothetical protein [Lachnospiraceae bacterium]
MKTVLMLFCLSRLKKISKYGMLSFCAVLIVYVYTPFNIDTFSYNTIPLMGLLYIITILNSNRQSIIEAFLCGIVISFVVLSQPFCALIYLFLIIYFGGGIILGNKKYFEENNNRLPYLVNSKGMLWFTAGIVFVSVVFFIIVFSRASFTDVVNNVSVIFSDPDHKTDGIIGWIGKLWWGAYGFIFEYKIITAINFLTVMFLFITKRKIKTEVLTGVVVVIFFISSIYVLAKRDSFLGTLVFVPCLWMLLEVYIIFFKALMKREYIPGILIFLGYTAGIAFATNTGYLSVTAGVVIAVAYTFMVLEKSVEGRIDKILKAVAFFILGETMISHVVAIGDGFLNFSEYKYVIEQGPLKGTITDKKIFDSYNKVIDDLKVVMPLEEDAVLFCGTSTPMAYLYLDAEYSTYGPYFLDMNYDRYKLYLKMHPDKYPSIVYYESLDDKDRESFLYDYVINNYSIIIQDGESFIAKK